MLLAGATALKVEHIFGSGDNGPYSFTRVHALDGVQVHQCRIADSWPKNEPIIEGEVFSAVVSVRPYVGRSGPALGVTLEAPVPNPPLHGSKD